MDTTIDQQVAMDEGLYHKRNVDFAYLTWEDFVYQLEHKDTKKSNEMYCLRFTKPEPEGSTQGYPLVSIEVLRYDKSSKSEYKGIVLTEMELILENTQQGAAPPKPKASVKRTRSSSNTSITPLTAAVAMSEAQQLKLVTKRSMQQMHISQASGSGVNEGTEEEEDELYKDVNINQGRGIQANIEVEDSHVTLTLVNPDVSAIPEIVQRYKDQRMNETVKVAVQIQSDRLRDEPQRENDEFLKTVDENMQKIIKEHVKEQVKVQVSKILPRIEQTMNEQLKAEVLTRSFHSSKTSYVVDALVEAYESDKIILDTYRETVTLKRRRDDDADKDEEPFAVPDRGSKRRRERKEPESASAPTETATRSAGRMKNPSLYQTGGPRDVEKERSLSQQALLRKLLPGALAGQHKGAEDQPIIQSSQHPEWFSQQQNPPSPDRDWDKTVPTIHGSIQPWISELAKQTDSRSSFNELMDTPLDFSNFLINRLKVDTLTPELLAGPAYELKKGSFNSLVEPEYHLEEVFKATTYQLDWVNPEGQQTACPLGVSQWGRKRQQFYGFAVNQESARDVYSKSIIIAVTELKIVEWHNYKHLDWITFYGFAVNQESARDVYSKSRIIAVTELKIVDDEVLKLKNFKKDESKSSQVIQSRKGEIVRYMKSIDHSIEISLSPQEANWAIGRPKAIMSPMIAHLCRPNDYKFFTMNYQPVVAGNQPTHNAGIQENLDAGKVRKETISTQQYVLLLLWSTGSNDPQTTDVDAAFDVKDNENTVHVSLTSSDKPRKHDEKAKREAKGKSLVNAASAHVTAVGPNSTNNTNKTAAGPSDNAVSLNFDIGGKSSFVDPSQYLDDPDMPALEDIVYSNDEEDVGAKADFSNLETSITVSLIPTTRVHKDYLVTQIMSDLTSTPQTRSMARMKNPREYTKHSKILVRLKLCKRSFFNLRCKRNKARLVAHGHTQEEGIGYEEVFALVARIEAIRLFLAYASFMGFMVYVDDIIFGSTNKELCKAFEKLIKDKFQMSSMGEITFFLGLQVKQKDDGIFISQDTYVAEILRKFGLTDGKSASTPIDTKKPLLKDPDVKRIFRYLKGKPHLGLWYPKDSPFNLVAYSDSYYVGASLDRKSTIGGCQLLGCRLISWQCKKQTIVTTSLTEAEYVAVAS
nr:copia protein [Tanacetum cinerariifolium]